MKVVASNCGCCAIKHIRDFPNSPTVNQYLMKESGHDEDQSSSSPEPYENWDSALTYDKVMMPAGDILKGLVAQIRDRRPQGMITLNLVASHEDDNYCCSDCDGPRNLYSSNPSFDYEQIENWHPLLTDLGFSSTKFLNSNSDNEIHHYTLVYDDGRDNS